MTVAQFVTGLRLMGGHVAFYEKLEVAMDYDRLFKDGLMRVAHISLPMYDDDIALLTYDEALQYVLNDIGRNYLAALRPVPNFVIVHGSHFD